MILDWKQKRHSQHTFKQNHIKNDVAHGITAGPGHSSGFSQCIKSLSKGTKGACAKSDSFREDAPEEWDKEDSWSLTTKGIHSFINDL